jgi:PhzF family phenazine biosynthesis protein
MTAILRYSAFTTDPAGGNPAGVVLDAAGLDDAAMLAIAAEVGYSETAFAVPAGDDPRTLSLRYFSPLAEVAFCGHATIATGVALAERLGPGTLAFATAAGPVRVETAVEGGTVIATLTSPPTRTRPATGAELAEALAALRWRAGDLDDRYPPHVANAGNDHLVLAAATRERLADLDYDFDRLGALMAAGGWTTVHLVHAAAPDRFHARDPFPPGGVVEDPATGAAAAAFGGYLRSLGLVRPPAEIEIAQGEDMGRPGRLRVRIPPDGGIEVGGTAVALR